MTVSRGATIVYSEDFSGYTAGAALAGQNGWETPGDNSVVTHATQTLVTGVAGNTNEVAYKLSAFTLSATTTSVTIDVMLRGRLNNDDSNSFEASFAILNDGGTVFDFGNVSGTGFRLRNQSGSTIFSGTGSSDDAIINGSHRLFDNRFTYDFENATWSWEVRNTGGDANYTLIASGDTTDFGVSPLIDDPANWSGVLLTSRSASDIIDNIVITAVPEPASAVLLGLAGTVLFFRRRR